MIEPFHLTIISCVVAAFSVIHTYFLPRRWRDHLYYWGTLVRKYASNSDVKITMVSKAQLGTINEHLPEETAIDMIKSEMKAHHPYIKESKIEADVMLEKRKIHVVISLYLEAADVDNEQLQMVLTGVEIRIDNSCKFRNISECVVEMREAREKIGDAMRNIGLKTSSNVSIICYLKSLPQANILLEATKADSIECIVNGNNLELFNDKMIYNCSAVTRDTVNFIKKILIAYS